jgi:hypothetical protein
MMTEEEFQAHLKLWPNCAVPDCPNKCCLRLRSEFCYPHTKGLPLQTQRRKTEV